MTNAYPKFNKRGNRTSTWGAKCGCIFKEAEIEKIKVRTRFFLNDGAELISPKIRKEWTIKKHNE